jgi:hypothetical protein
MELIKFSAVSPSEAEEIIAEVWRVIDEYGRASPLLHCRFGSNQQVSIDLEFEDHDDADLIMRFWRHRADMRSLELAPRMQPSVTNTRF